MRREKPNTSYAFLPLTLVVIVVFFALFSSGGGIGMQTIEASVDEEKLGVAMDGSTYFIFLSDIEAVELLGSVPDSIPDDAETFIGSDSGLCISVRHKDGLLLLNFSTNRRTKKLFNQLETALVSVTMDGNTPSASLQRDWESLVKLTGADHKTLSKAAAMVSGCSQRKTC